MFDHRNPVVSRVVRCAPPESAISSWYPGADLLDSYAITTQLPLDATMRSLATAMIDASPLWLKALLWLRNLLVSPFGVKTTDDLKQATDRDRRIDFFRIHSETPDEIVLGDDDRHLDFRVSLLKRSTPDGTVVIAAGAMTSPTHFIRTRRAS